MVALVVGVLPPSCGVASADRRVILLIMAQVVVTAVLVAASTSAPPLDPVEMAHIAVGEAGGLGIWGTDERTWAIQAMVVWVARNQWASLWFPADYDPKAQFFAWEEEVAGADVARAAAVIGAPQETDPTGGALHVISEQDRIKLGFPEGDIVERGMSPFALHFYRVWPGVETYGD